MEAILSFSIGVLSVLLVAFFIKVIQLNTKLNSLESEQNSLKTIFSILIEELRETKEGLDILADQVIQLSEDIDVDSEEFKERLDDINDRVQEFNELTEDDIVDIHDQLEDIEERLDVVEDDSHPPISKGSTIELKSQIEKLKKAFKKVLKK